MLGLLAHLALLLERVGSTPAHRNGTAAVYGRHLKVYVRRRAVAMCLNHHALHVDRTGPVMSLMSLNHGNGGGARPLALAAPLADNGGYGYSHGWSVPDNLAVQGIDDLVWPGE